MNDASYWPRKNASGKYWMDSQCNWLNGSSKARKEERRGGVFFWVYVTPRVRPDITEQIEAESCSYPAVCSATPRECALLPSSQLSISLPLSPPCSLYFPLPAVFHIPHRLFLFPSIDPTVPFLFSRLSPQVTGDTNPTQSFQSVIHSTPLPLPTLPAESWPLSLSMHIHIHFVALENWIKYFVYRW